VGQTDPVVLQGVWKRLKEYTYRVEDFVGVFEEEGFRLRMARQTPLNDLWILLFIDGR
jgi:hypothetical protein